MTLEEHGERVAAVEALRKAVDRGATHPDPDARKLAAQSAYRLHQMLIADGSPADARAQVAVIEELVPIAAARPRTTFAGIAAHSRGMQHHAERTGRKRRAARSSRRKPWPGRPARSRWCARRPPTSGGWRCARSGPPTPSRTCAGRSRQVPGESAGDEHARRAEILWLLSDTHMMMERPEQALRECRRVRPRP